MRWKLVTPNERLLIVSPVNRYKVAGPGRVFLGFRQRLECTMYVGPQAKTLHIEQVRTAENIPLNVALKVIYQATPDTFDDSLLPKLPGLSNGGWGSSVEWQAEYVLRQLVAAHSWRELGRQEVQTRLERQFKEVLSDRLGRVGLTALAVCFVKVGLPAKLQEMLVQAEEDSIEAKTRANVLKSYMTVFGSDLSNALPHIIQWEMMSTIHKSHPQILLTPGNGLGQPNGTGQQVYQMQLPIRAG